MMVGVVVVVVVVVVLMVVVVVTKWRCRGVTAFVRVAVVIVVGQV